MSANPDVAGDLKSKLSKADARVRRLESTLSNARKERDELATALRVLVKLGHIEDDSGAASDEIEAATANERQSLVLDQVPEGQQYAVAPKDVTSALHALGLTDITADYVRTTLWRFAQRELLKNADGLYWRAITPDTENVTAPDARTSEADNFMGPATGRGTGFPPTPPEGSIPSGSTPPSDYKPWHVVPDDDDIPF